MRALSSLILKGLARVWTLPKASSWGAGGGVDQGTDHQHLGFLAALGPDPLQHLGPGQLPGKHEVEEDQVGVEVGDGGQPLSPRPGHPHLAALHGAEQGRLHVGEGVAVLDDEHLPDRRGRGFCAAHGRSSIAPGGVPRRVSPPDPTATASGAAVVGMA